MEEPGFLSTMLCRLLSVRCVVEDPIPGPEVAWVGSCRQVPGACKRGKWTGEPRSPSGPEPSRQGGRFSRRWMRQGLVSDQM